jgi:hypothetical protein
MRFVFSLLFFGVAFSIESYAAQDNSSEQERLKATPETMRLGWLSVNIVNNPKTPCNTREAVAAVDAAATLIAPLAESLADTAGQYILEQSGKSKVTLAMEGLATSYFYCAPRTFSEREEQRFYLNPLEMTLKSPITTKSRGKPGFSATLKFETSKDGTAYRIVPVRTSYQSPVMNSRAYGLLLQISINDLQEYSESVVLPLGFSRCGRVGNECSEGDKTTFNTMASRWIPVGPAKVSTLSKVSVGSVPGDEFSHLTTPINITAKLVEISTYDKFLEFLGNFLVANKSSVKDVLIGTLPPITQKDRQTLISTRATLAVAKVSYEVAKQSYLQKVKDNKPCADQVEAWKLALAAAVEAKVDSFLVTRPPSCID